MVSVNGNHGFFGQIREKVTTDKQIKQQSKIDVPMVEPEKVHKEFGDELLTQGFYPDVRFTKPLTNQTISALNSNEGFMGKLNDLQGLSSQDRLVVPGCDPDKLARHMEKSLGENTAVGLNQFEFLLG